MSPRQGTAEYAVELKNLLKDIIRNPENYYVNVHTAAFPNCAVRGQLA